MLFYVRIMVLKKKTQKPHPTKPNQNQNPNISFYMFLVVVLPCDMIVSCWVSWFILSISTVQCYLQGSIAGIEI